MTGRRTSGDMPDLVPPMSVSTGSGQPPLGADWVVELAWTGHRCIAYVEPGRRTRLLSANAVSMTAAYPELAAPLERHSPPRGMVLDGTVVARGEEHAPRARLLQRRSARFRPSEAHIRETPVDFQVADLLWLDGHSTVELPFRDRRALLEGLGFDSAPVWTTSPLPVSELDTMLRIADAKGVDALHARHLGARYHPGGRSPLWLKVPVPRTRRVVVGGWTATDPRRNSAIASLLLGVPDGDGTLRYVGRVGVAGEQRRQVAGLRSLYRPSSPFTDAVPADAARNAMWVHPRLVGLVDFSGWVAGGRLRLPRWRGFVETERPGGPPPAETAGWAFPPETVPQPGAAPAGEGQAGRSSSGDPTPSGPRPDGAQPAGGRPAGTRPRPAGSRPAGSQPGGSRPAGTGPGAPPAGAQPGDPHSAGTHPTGQQSAGRDPAGRQPAGQQPAGRQPAGQDPAGQDPTGQDPTGHHPAEQQPAGQDPAGPPPTRRHPTGQQPAAPPPGPAPEPLQAPPAQVSPLAGMAPPAVPAAETRRLEQHFVYNALNTIAALIRTDPARARELLFGFADLSRAADRPADAVSTLGGELDAVRGYLQLEQARFGARLRVELDVDAAVHAVPVEPLRVLGAVRDAVQRDIEPSPQGGVLTVTARAADGGATVTVVGGAGEPTVLALPGAGISITAR